MTLDTHNALGIFHTHFANVVAFALTLATAHAVSISMAAIAGAFW